MEGGCGVRPVTTFETEGYRSRVASEVCLDRVAAAFTPLERRRWSRGDQIRRCRGDGSAHGLRRARQRVRARTYRRAARRWDGRPASQRKLPTHRHVPRHRSRPSVTGVESLLQHTRRHHRFALRPARPPLLHRRGLLVEHDRDRSGCRCDPRWTVGRCARRRDRRAGPTDVQRLQRAEADGSGAVSSVRPRARGHEHRRGGRDPRARGAGAGARPRRCTSTASWPATSFACEAFHPTAPEPDGQPVGAVIAQALRDAASMRTRSITSTRTAPPRRRTIAPRRAGLPGDLRRPHGAHAGHVAEVDDRPLPRRRRRARSGGAGDDASIAASSRRRSTTPTPIPNAPCDVVANERASSASAVWGSTSLGFGGNDSAVLLRAV